jgi:hypothetical protein
MMATFSVYQWLWKKARRICGFLEILTVSQENPPQFPPALPFRQIFGKKLLLHHGTIFLH